MGILPIVVFDGAELPAKAHTRVARQFSRASSQARGVALTEYGRDVLNEPSTTSSTGESNHCLIHDLCVGLSLLGVEARVAPYETDAQLTYMLRAGIVDTVVTEDSDLVVFGCPRIICKIDPKTGIGIEFSDPLTSSGLQGLTLSGLQLAAILAGCDYGPNITGVGIRKAIEISLKCQEYCDDDDALRRYLQTRLIGLSWNSGDPGDIYESIRRSRYVFKYQTIFDEVDGRLRPLNNFGPSGVPECFRDDLGPIYSRSIAKGVFHGAVHPTTHEPLTPSVDIEQIVDSEVNHSGAYFWPALTTNRFTVSP